MGYVGGWGWQYMYNVDIREGSKGGHKLGNMLCAIQMDMVKVHTELLPVFI